MTYFKLKTNKRRKYIREIMNNPKIQEEAKFKLITALLI